VSEEIEAATSVGTAGAPAEHPADSAFATAFSAHAAHVFDYCRAIAGSDAVAASATVAALLSAWELPAAPHLLRARLVAAARREVHALAVSGASQTSGLAAAGLQPYRAVVAVLSDLPAGPREVLALVYRHGVWPEQLPAVLGVSGMQAYERLAAAEHDFVAVAVARSSEACARPRLEDIAAVPLAVLPWSVWRDAARQLTDRSSTRAPLPPTPPLVVRRSLASRPRPRPRAWLAAGAVLPVAAIGCWAIVAGVGPAYPLGARAVAEPAALSIRPASSRPARTPDAAVPEPARQGSVPVKQNPAPAVPILTLLPATPAGTVLPVSTTVVTRASAHPAPATSPSVAAAPSPAPSPSSVPASPTPTPSQSASDSPSASPSPSDSTSSAAPSPSPSDSSSVPAPSPTS
jgi:DNA-directed RNA polymerase specialized sigma24 family protein